MAKQDAFGNEIAALSKVLSAVSGLDQPAQEFVFRTAIDRLQLNLSELSISKQSSSGSGEGIGSGSGNHRSPSGEGGSSGSPIRAKQFMDEKKPLTDVERIACLAFLLAHNNNQHAFKTADITKMNTEAAQKPFSNSSYAMGNAEQSGYITKAGKHGDKQITSFGEKIVDALPDRDKVKETIAASRKGHARRRANRKKSKASR